MERVRRWCLAQPYVCAAVANGLIQFDIISALLRHLLASRAENLSVAQVAALVRDIIGGATRSFETKSHKYTNKNKQNNTNTI